MKITDNVYIIKKNVMISHLYIYRNQTDKRINITYVIQSKRLAMPALKTGVFLRRHSFMVSLFALEDAACLYATTNLHYTYLKQKLSSFN